MRSSTSFAVTQATMSSLDELLGLVKSIEQKLQGILPAPGPAPAAPATPPAAQKPAAGDHASAFAPGVDPTLSVDELTGIMSGLRSDLVRTGRGLGAIVGAVLTGIGYTQVHDFFPFPADAPGWVRSGVVAAAVAGTAAATFLVVRFYYAQRRILIGSDLKGLPLTSFRDTRLATRITEQFAHQEGAATILALDLRASRLGRIARELGPNDARTKAIESEAQRLEAVVRLALTRTAASLLERRTRGAFGGMTSWIAIALAVGGVGFSFAVADYAKGKRSLPQEQIIESNACVARVNNSTGLSDADKQKLIEACVKKASAALAGATTTTSTTTASTTSTATTGTSTTSTSTSKSTTSGG